MDLNQKNSSTLADSRELARAITAVLIEKKALDVKLYNVSGDSSITDYYVNVTGRSSTQVLSLADEVVYKIGLLGRNELRVEGRSGRSWMLVDYGDVIVNVFDVQSREFYDLDRLLPADRRMDIEPIRKMVDEKFKIEK